MICALAFNFRAFLLGVLNVRQGDGPSGRVDRLNKTSRSPGASAHACVTGHVTTTRGTGRQPCFLSGLPFATQRGIE